MDIDDPPITPIHFTTNKSVHFVPTQIVQYIYSTPMEIDEPPNKVIIRSII